MIIQKFQECEVCKVLVQLWATDEQWELWDHLRAEGGSTVLIQSVFPEWTAEQREMLITSICGTCFDKLFAEVR